MRIRSTVATLALTAGLVVGGVAGLAGPASADTANTTATFVIGGGGLAISVPASSAINTGTVNSGAATATGQLGAVTVADTRGAVLNSWTTMVSSTPFLAGPSADETVALINIAYSSGLGTAHSGLGAFVPGSAANLATAGTAGTHVGSFGNSSTTWNPTLTFTLRTSQVAGTYSGTITHSVA
jgi:hypothetical protein